VADVTAEAAQSYRLSWRCLNAARSAAATAAVASLLQAKHEQGIYHMADWNIEVAEHIHVDI
jgi:hypothetical protein